MENSIIFHQTPINEFRELIADVVDERLKNFQPLIPKQPALKYLTRKETAQTLSVSLVTLNEWTKEGKIQGCRIGSRVRYRLTDVESAVQNIHNIKHSRSK